MAGVGDRHDRSGSGGGVVQYRSGACVGWLASRTGAIRSFGQGLRSGLGDGVGRVFGDCFSADAGRGVGMIWRFTLMILLAALGRFASALAETIEVDAEREAGGGKGASAYVLAVQICRGF